jgi:DNA adenine methylase
MAYPGGKSTPGTYQRIINLMPPHDTYVEPFLGGGAILRMKRPAKVSIGIDLDREVIRSWQRAQPPGVAALDPPAPVASSAGSRPRSHAAGKNGAAAQFYFRLGCGIDYLRVANLTARDLVYADPPYLLSARSGCERDYYRHEMTDHQHRELLRVLRGLKCMVILSGYESHLYSTMLKGWNVETFQGFTRRGPATEWLWFNFPAPTQLHDYRYLGNDRREREYLKRKISRWKGKLERMNGLERQALLAAIGDAAVFSGGTR